MLPDKSAPIQPIAVTVIGTGDGSTEPIAGAIGVTPGTQPNLVVTIVTPLAAILIRFANNYLTMLVGLVAAGMTSNIIPATDFLHLVYECAKLAIAGAGLGLLKDIVTVVSGLERTHPLSTGSV